VITLKITIEGWDRIRESLGTVRGRVIPTMIKTARRGVWLHVVPQTRNAIAQQSGIGRTIWGRDQSGLEKQGLVKQGKLLIDPQWGRTSLLLRGIPALLEDGGRIKPHIINNPFGRKGVMYNRRYISGGMRHPGMTLRAHGFGRDSMDKGMDPIQREVDEAIGEMLRRNGL
jgi:hypothetical protein